MEPMPTNHHLLELAEEEGPWVTITMPLEGGGPLAKGDPIRYRNLLRSLDEPFEARVIDPELRARMMEPLRALADRHDVFNAGARGLVVFANAKRVEHWHLPVPLEEDARVDERPYLEPLIPLVTDPTHFYVVALSMQQLRLLECNRFVYRELPLPPGTPTRLEEAAGWEIRQPARYIRYGAHSAFHGHGVVKDDVQPDLEKYVRDLDQGLWQAITHKSSPVVLMASEQLEPVFRSYTRLPNLLETTLHGSADHTSNEELHAKALPLVEAQFEEQLEEAKSRFHDRLGTGLATSQIAEVVVAAAEGRVDTLFIREGTHVPGRFDEETHSVSLGNGRADTTDLLDRASTDAFLRGGTIYRLAPERMPVEADAAAILRY
jgi:hypothetical protein